MLTKCVPDTMMTPLDTLSCKTHTHSLSPMFQAEEWHLHLSDLPTLVNSRAAVSTQVSQTLKCFWRSSPWPIGLSLCLYFMSNPHVPVLRDLFLTNTHTPPEGSMPFFPLHPTKLQLFHQAFNGPGGSMCLSCLSHLTWYHFPASPPTPLRLSSPCRSCCSCFAPCSSARASFSASFLC